MKPRRQKQNDAAFSDIARRARAAAIRGTRARFSIAENRRACIRLGTCRSGSIP